jgi:hypothetical protein
MMVLTIIALLILLIVLPIILVTVLHQVQALLVFLILLVVYLDFSVMDQHLAMMLSVLLILSHASPASSATVLLLGKTRNVSLPLNLASKVISAMVFHQVQELNAFQTQQIVLLDSLAMD